MLEIREAILSDLDGLYDLYMNHLTKKTPEDPQDIFKWSELLEKLILEGDKLTSTISYVPAPDGVWRTYAVYKTSSPEGLHSE